jgi:hypothetical protein
VVYLDDPNRTLYEWAIRKFEIIQQFCLILANDVMTFEINGMARDAGLGAALWTPGNDGATTGLNVATWGATGDLFVEQAIPPNVCVEVTGQGQSHEVAFHASHLTALRETLEKIVS